MHSTDFNTENDFKQFKGRPRPPPPPRQQSVDQQQVPKPSRPPPPRTSLEPAAAPSEYANLGDVRSGRVSPKKPERVNSIRAKEAITGGLHYDSVSVQAAAPTVKSDEDGYIVQFYGTCCRLIRLFSIFHSVVVQQACVHLRQTFTFAPQSTRSSRQVGRSLRNGYRSQFPSSCPTSRTGKQQNRPLVPPPISGHYSVDFFFFLLSAFPGMLSLLLLLFRDDEINVYILIFLIVYWIGDK